jgi:predicted transcriptional regulator of viral defense system
MNTRGQSMDHTRRILEMVEQAGVLRPRDLDAHGIPRIYLSRLCERGILQRVGRGLYVLSNADVSEHHTLAEAGKRVPHGVVCLLSALRFHGLTTQAPFEVWLAIGSKVWRPQVDYPRLRFVRFSARALEAGVEEHSIEGVIVRVYNPAKTVADCFKYRNKIGLDVALEALRDCRRQRICTNDKLWHYAKICRVANVIRPYMEATA